MTRPPIDQWWMKLAKTYAEQSTCPRAHVGVMIANGRNFVAAGYNGAKSGAAHCTQVGCKMKDGHCVRARHAERNALEFGGKYRTQGAALYTTHFPCVDCARMIVDYGIACVVYDEPYRIKADVLEHLRQNGVEVRRLDAG